MPDSHAIWSAAQLAPGEGIEDGVARIEALLALPAAGRAQFALQALVAAGHVTQAKVDQALALSPPPAAVEPEMPEVDTQMQIPYESIRYVAGYTEQYVKDYARAWGDARAEHARRVAMEEAYNVLFAVKGDKATLFDAQTAIRAAAPPQGEQA